MNATIFIDDKEIGKMTRAGKDGSGAIISLKPGHYQLKVVSTKGEEFKQEFDIQGENYIAVVFEN
ncbi:MAG: hypothetical protein L0Y80_07940 [Ignavibacteriae bacterium]|nr:hypothetical protein [Ignavibacteriota bacterium]